MKNRKRSHPKTIFPDQKYLGSIFMDQIVNSLRISTDMSIKLMTTFSILTATRRWLRNYYIEARRFYLNNIWGMHIAEGCAISHDAKLDKANPRGIHIGRDTAVNVGAAILAHDFVRMMHVDTRIGERCQIGALAIIMPGITVGDDCIIAAGSVVMRDVPPGSIVFGNPGRVIENGIVTGKWGVILSRKSKSPLDNISYGVNE
jgi:serine acetyltransferase